MDNAIEKIDCRETNDTCYLSIVVPVYNTKEFLRVCLDSLLNQDLKPEQFEVICVDDGSTDESPSILAEYAEKYSSVKVITQKNAGHAAARNTGLFAAKGKYVWFVDSDDFVDINSFGFIVNLMEKNEIDLLSINRIPFYKNEELPTAPANYSEKFRKRANPTACSGVRIFSRQLLKDENIIWNAEMSPCDDIEFVFYAQTNAKNEKFNDSVTYYHRQWEGSVTSQKSEKSQKKYKDSFYLLAKVYNKEMQNPKYDKKMRSIIEDRRNLSVQAIMMQSAMYDDKSETDELLKRLKEDGLYPFRPVIYNLKPKLSLKRTVMDWAQFLFPIEKYYRFACRLFKK